MIVKAFTKENEQLFYKLCKEFYSSGSTLRGYDEEIAKKTFNRILDHHENLFGYYIIRQDSDEVIGYAIISSYWCNEEGGNVLILDELYISPEERHQGYATLFIDWLEKDNKDKAVSISLEVLTSNINAQNLYKKEGFAPDGFQTLTKEFNK